MPKMKDKNKEILESIRAIEKNKKWKKYNL